jgi:hypothetical protein
LFFFFFGWVFCWWLLLPWLRVVQLCWCTARLPLLLYRLRITMESCL